MTTRQWLGENIFYDPDAVKIWTHVAEDGKHCIRQIADIRGWGELQHLFEDINEAHQFQDKVGEFIVEAIKEKLQREQ